MICPKCQKNLEGAATFCPRCGGRLHEIIKEEIRKEISSELKETCIPDGESALLTPSGWNKITKHNEEIGKSSFHEQTAEDTRAEYKNLLKEVFADGIVTPDELILLSEKRKVLGLSQTEALEVQRDTARDLGIEIKDEGDLFTGVLLEINTNKDYFLGEMNNLEFRITNRSGSSLEKVCLSSYFEMLGKKEEKSIPKMKSNQQEVVRLPFKHTDRGDELVEIRTQYFDDKGNPSILKAEIEVGIATREERREGHKSISISVTAEKIMGNDFSNLAEILGEKREPGAPKRSFYEEAEKLWRRLPAFLDEEETIQWRDQIVIAKKLSEGERYFCEGEALRQDAEKVSLKDKGKTAAHESFSQAVHRLKEAKNCFLKVREIDQEHVASLERIRQVDHILSEIEHKVGKLGKEVGVPKIHLNSACLKLADSQKRIFLYSKEKITLGRQTQNDMVLRLVPNAWKEEYDEEVRTLLKGKVDEIPVEYFPDKKHKANLIHTVRISSSHAEIAGKAGHFYLRDVGSKNGTFVAGKKLDSFREHVLENGSRINIAGVLDLECKFYGEYKKEYGNRDIQDSCFTVLGERSDSCFGIDKKGSINAIKFRRLNNDPEGEEYLILIREITIGRDRSNAFAVDVEKVSDIHARIFYRDQQYWIEDLNSRYGTSINGEEIGSGVEVPLGKQAEIVVGDAKLLFEGVL